ncbi:MAG: hypothetical protein FWD75_11420, partial [Propionibacteriaceae bacterium]|nr:hypothetical protein [Propionibacteriaceae bacterium]
MLTAMVSTGWQVAAAGASPSDDNPEVSVPAVAGDSTATGVDVTTPQDAAPAVDDPASAEPASADPAAPAEDTPGDRPGASEAAPPAADTPAPEEPAPASVDQPDSTPVAQQPAAQTPVGVSAAPEPSTPVAPVAPQAAVVPVTPVTPVTSVTPVTPAQATSSGTTRQASSVPMVSAPDVPSTCAVPAPKAGQQYLSMTQWSYQLTNGKGQPLAANAKVKAGDKINYTFMVRVDRLGAVKALGVSGLDLDKPATCVDAGTGVQGMTQCTGVHTITKAEASAHGTSSTACVQGMHVRDTAWSQGSADLSLAVDFAAKSAAQVPVATATSSAKSSALPKPIVTTTSQDAQNDSVASALEAPAEAVGTVPVAAPTSAPDGTLMVLTSSGLAVLLGAAPGVDPGTGVIPPITEPGGGTVNPIVTAPGSGGLQGIQALDANKTLKECLLVSFTVEPQCWPPQTGDSVRIQISISLDKSVSGCAAVKGFDLTGSVVDPVTGDVDATKTANELTAPVKGDGSPCSWPFTGSGQPAIASNGDPTYCYVSYTPTEDEILGGGTIPLVFGATGEGANTNDYDSAEAKYEYDLSLTGMDLVKTASLSTDEKTITYNYTVTNNGKAPVNNVMIDESGFGGQPGGIPSSFACGSPTAVLQVGDHATCSIQYAVTQQDAINGSVTNTAKATAKTTLYTTNGTVCQPRDVASNDSTADVDIPPHPAISLDKQAVASTLTAYGTLPAVGSTIEYAFTITNTGNVSLTGVGVAELAGFTGVHGHFTLNPTCTYGTTGAHTGTAPNTELVLDPTESAVCTATYVVQQEDIDHGSLDNYARASGTDESGTTVTGDDSLSIQATADPKLAVTKTVTPGSVDGKGVTVAYIFTVTNTGNVTLTGVNFHDDTVDASTWVSGTVGFTGTGTWTGPTDCQLNDAAHTTVHLPATLHPGDVVTCTASYTVTQPDADRGSVINVVTASGTDPAGHSVASDPARADVTITEAASLHVTKAASRTTATTAGTMVYYTFTVENTGNVTVSGVVFNDPQVSLAAWSATTAGFTGSDGLSDSLTWACYLNDPTGPPMMLPVSLAPGDVATCLAGYELTQTDVDNGVVWNTVTATGTDPKGEPVDSDAATAMVTMTPSPSMELVKDVTPSTASAAGDHVAYTFMITNTGNVTLDGLSITDPTVSSVSATTWATGMLGFTGTGTWTGPTDCYVGADPTDTIALSAVRLAPQASVTCVATYAVTQDDVDAGHVWNRAQASGEDPAGHTVPSNKDEADVTITAAPALTVTKVVDPATATAAGDTVTYTFTVKNTGNVTVSTVRFSDPSVAFGAWSATTAGFTGTGTWTGPGACQLHGATAPSPLSLAPGDVATCTATYTLTQTDVDHGVVHNTVTASGADPAGHTVPSDPAWADVTITEAASLAVTKSADPVSVVEVGQQVTYTFHVTNDGNVTIHDVAIAEGAFDGKNPDGLQGLHCPVATLAPEASEDCTATYVVVQGDLDTGSFTNHATATGTDEAGDTVESAADQATVLVSKVELSKTGVIVDPGTGDPLDFTDPGVMLVAGDQVTYHFQVTNTGTTTLTGVT